MTTDDLILKTLPVVRHISRKRSNGNKDREEEYFAWGSCKLVKIASKCQDERTFSGYAAMVIDGGILDYLRKTSKQQVTSLADDDAFIPDKPHSLFWEEITQGLKPKWRDALILYYRDNFTLEEVGQVLGCGKTYVGRILHEVKDYIKDNRDEEDLRALWCSVREYF